MAKRPLLLCILDGFGWVPNETYGNAIVAAKTPNLDKLFAECPYTTIGASGMDEPMSSDCGRWWLARMPVM